MKGADSENSPLPFLFLFAPKKKTLPVELPPIPLGVIRQHGEDVALDAGTERAGCEHRRGGRYAAREPVISEERAHLFHGVLAFHGDYAVESGDVHERGDEIRAYALDEMGGGEALAHERALGGFDGVDLAVDPVFEDILLYAHGGAAAAHAGDHGFDAGERGEYPP